MKNSNYVLSAILLTAFCLLTTIQSHAQRRVDYRQLAMKNQHQPLYFDFFVLPDKNKSSVTFASVFSLSYKFLPFQKGNPSSSGDTFSATADLNMEVFKSEKSALGNNKDLSIKGLESVGRSFWSDTAHADGYEQSQSPDHFLSGQLSLSLKPGIYNYVLQMNRGNKNNNKLSRVRSIKIESFDQMKTGNIILGDELLNRDPTPNLKLIGMGNRVRYGKDFYALIYIPSFSTGSTYKLTVNKLTVADKDTTQTGSVYSTTLSDQDIQTGIIPELESDNKNGVSLSLSPSQGGYTYALVKIPNSTLQNAVYRLNVQTENNKMVAKGIFRSIWLDMPNSLLSLDVSINMLHFITDKQTIKNISGGSKEEREKKFRSFWKERDPTPKTEFNELMTEYYRRVDYAYDHFSGSETPGYDTDQGTIYIKYGPPKNIDRKFPATGATVEIWTYPSREFIFKATSGFGDFRLTNKQNN